MHGENLPEWVHELTSSLDDRLGVELLEVSPERVVARAPVEGNTQPAGLWHGGASGVLVETVGSMGAFAWGRTRGLGAAGIELSVSHHRGVRAGWVHATATATQLGGRLASYRVELTDDDGRLVASGRTTCMLVATA